MSTVNIAGLEADKRAREYQAQHPGVKYPTALNVVMAQDPVLARLYNDEHLAPTEGDDRAATAAVRHAAGVEFESKVMGRLATNAWPISRRAEAREIEMADPANAPMIRRYLWGV